ncbi:MAG TPA: polysaccharide biosynthesis tyrosine autokinase [Kofleriaceae bacterium]
MESGETQSRPDDQVLRIDFARYLNGLRKYIWLVGALVIVAVAGAVVFTSRQTPIYESTASIQIEPKTPDLLGTGELFNAGANGASTEYYKQQREVLESYMLCARTVTEHDLIDKLLTPDEKKGLSQQDQVQAAALKLRDQITVKYPDQNRIMYVAVRNASKTAARDFANFHVDTYLLYTQGLFSENTSKGEKALEDEFNETEKKLRESEDKIYKFQAENDMIAVTLEEHQSLVASNILAFTQKLNDSVGDQIKLSSKLAVMKKDSGADVLSTPIVMMGDNPSYEALRTQYYTEKTHLIELEKDLGPKNSEYVSQKEKVDELYKAMQGEVKILVDGTQDLYDAQSATNRGLAAEVERYKDEAKKLSPKIVVYNDLVREKRDYEDKYNILRARLSTTQMTTSMSQFVSNVRKLDDGLLPTKPVSPNMRNNVLAAGVAALAVGIALVMLFVFLDRSVKSTADASAAAGVPVLGIIPMLTEADTEKDGTGRIDDRKRDMYVHEHPNSQIAECCRLLRTNVMFSAADHPLETIVVCSANAREGKTTSVIYLGTTIAQSGQKVLLVDTDMRRPRLHASTGVSRARGLSNLILGDEDYDGIIQPTEIPNLFVLPCGPTPPNPAELLMSKRFETVLAELKKRFPRIILDSPPLGPVTDAVVLSRHTDGVLMVARSGKTMRDDLARAARMVKDVGGEVFGVIVNELDRRDRDSYYYYGYYNTYGEESPGTAKPAA